MTAIPKGSSLAPRDASFMKAHGVERPFCVLCGQPFPDKHHEPPRGRIPKRFQAAIPLFSLCGPGNTAGTCHGLVHHNGGSVRIELTDRAWVFVLDSSAELRINVRRAKRGLPPILSTYEIERGGSR